MLYGRMGEIGLLLAGWDGWIGQKGWDMCGMEVLEVAGTRSGAPKLTLEVLRAIRSGGCHHFHRCCRGCGVFVSVQQNNHNTLYTNPNCNILQDSTNSTNNIIVL